ncbi:MAG: 2-succinyl-6-hydroxy-2,4-cyclohexadiene-1-carboxylate synthase [Chloroflexi bacterium]|nr:2-succinyl-6-hydroxy-2,4-cyclohexadiene-1-carboxylate synthase [Chloroflexota bacterium]
MPRVALTGTAPPGITLHAEVAGQGPPLVLLHGFTGSASSWTPFVEAVAGEWLTIAADVVGHGASDAPEALDHYRMEAAAADLVALLRALGHQRACWLGYSMGARVALHVAALHPEATAALVVEGGNPGIRDAAERAARVASDEALAERIEREGVPAFIDFWEAVPLFATQRELPSATWDAQRAGRLRNSPRGLANSLRGMGAGAHAPLWDRLAAVAAPALVLAGERDERYAAIGRELAAALPGATVHLVPGAGHNTHLERPAAFTVAVSEFLRGVARLATSHRRTS